ncbi:MAG TPA: hypothetical protein VGP07_04865 [Polyangia bacterium]|jgi:hypothetical protein
MKTALSLLLGLVSSVLLVNGVAGADGVMCALGPTTANYVPLVDQPASALTARETKRLFTLLCPKSCGQIGVFKNQTAPNALTVSVGNHMSKIAYNPAFLDGAVKSYGPGASLGILAHEIGHHVDSIVPPPPWINADWGNELRADAWAGCALARLGGKPAEVKGALQAIALAPSSAHPAWSVRAAALQKGFSGCGGATLAELGPTSSGAQTRGCAEDSECKGGRICLDGRCQEKSARQTLCSKDVDCPGVEVCGTAGQCQSPRAPGSGPSTTPERMASGPPVDCRDRCGDDQESCSGHTDVSLKACKAKLVADPRYKECSCPHWPSGRLDCYAFCKDTFDRAKSCEASHETAGSTCLSVAARCVSDCR